MVYFVSGESLVSEGEQINLCRHTPECVRRPETKTELLL